MAGPWELIRDALAVLAEPRTAIIRVIGNPVQAGGDLIEITMETEALRAAMLDYGIRILMLSALISAVTAVLAVHRGAAAAGAADPPGGAAHAGLCRSARRCAPGDRADGAGVEELRVAEEALASMQTQLTGALRQKERLAQLGGAVAKISHDLRNILTTAQLFADRIEGSADPAVARSAPKLVGSISRAVSLVRIDAGLWQGRRGAAEPEALCAGRRWSARWPRARGWPSDGAVTCLIDVAPGLMLRADPEQLYRVLSNLMRNARQAIEATGQPGTIEISAGEDAARMVDPGRRHRARACPQRRASICSRRFRAARAKAASAWAWPSRPSWCAAMAGGWSWCAAMPTEPNSMIHLPKGEGLAVADLDPSRVFALAMPARARLHRPALWTRSSAG